MPVGFAFPVNHDLWVPLRLHASDYARGEGPSIRVFGRLASGVTLEKAQAVLGVAAATVGLHWVMSFVASFTGEALPFWWKGALAPTTVLYAGCLTVLGAVVVGVLPALKVTGRK